MKGALVQNRHIEEVLWRFCPSGKLPSSFSFRSFKKADLFSRRFREGISFPNFVERCIRSCPPPPKALLCTLFSTEQSTFRGGEKGEKVPRKGEEEGWPAKGAKRKKGRAKTGQKGLADSGGLARRSPSNPRHSALFAAPFFLCPLRRMGTHFWRTFGLFCGGLFVTNPLFPPTPLRNNPESQESSL